MSRPIITRAPADQSALAGQTLAEIYSYKLGRGCLLSVRETTNPDGSHALVVELYRADTGVFVRVGDDLVPAAPRLFG